MFVPLTIGLALLTAVLQNCWHRTGQAEYLRLTKFFGTLLVINVAVGVVTAAVLARSGRHGLAFAATSVTIAAVTLSIFGELYPRVMVSTLGPANDLTVNNSASAPYALTVMTVTIAVLLPVILGYQGWTYHVFRRRIGRPSSPAVPPTEGTTDRDGKPPSHWLG